jgi:uncharacterized Rmd1/YagE family protein
VPDAYWDKPELEGLYSRIAREFEIGRRLSVVNQKLDYAHEVVKVRNEQLSGESLAYTLAYACTHERVHTQTNGQTDTRLVEVGIL